LWQCRRHADRLIRREAIAKQTIPKCVQAFIGGVCRRHRLSISAIVAGIRSSEAGGRMQRLMRIANEMDQPDEIIRLHVI
jgi:hypothetical protein